MRSATRTIVTLAASVLFLTGCGRLPVQPSDASPPQAMAGHTAASPAERTVTESLYDMTDVLFNFRCSDQGEVLDDHEGELVRLEGKVFARFTVLRDGAGSFHVTWHTMPIGLGGTGVTSGEAFRVTEREQGGSNQTLMGLSGRSWCVPVGAVQRVRGRRLARNRHAISRPRDRAGRCLHRGPRRQVCDARGPDSRRASLSCAAHDRSKEVSTHPADV